MLSKLAATCITLHVGLVILFAILIPIGYMAGQSTFNGAHGYYNLFWMPTGTTALMFIYLAFLVDTSRRLAFERYVWRKQTLTQANDLHRVWSGGLYQSLWTLYIQGKHFASPIILATLYFICIAGLHICAPSILGITYLDSSFGDSDLVTLTNTHLGLSDYLPQLSNESLSTLLNSSLLGPFLTSEKLEAPGLVNSTLYDSIDVGSGIRYARGSVNRTDFNCSCYRLPDASSMYNRIDGTWSIRATIGSEKVDFLPIVELAPNSIRSIQPRASSTGERFYQAFISTLDIMDTAGTAGSQLVLNPPMTILDNSGTPLITIAALTVTACFLESSRDIAYVDLGETSQTETRMSKASGPRPWLDFSLPNTDYISNYPSSMAAAIKLWPMIFDNSPSSGYPYVLKTNSTGNFPNAFSQMEQLIMHLLRQRPDYHATAQRKSAEALNALDDSISRATATIFYALSHSPVRALELAFRNLSGNIPWLDPSLSKGNVYLNQYDVFNSDTQPSVELNQDAVIASLFFSLVLLGLLLFMIGRYSPSNHSKTTLSVLQTMWLGIKQSPEVTDILDKVDNPTLHDLRLAGRNGELRTRVWDPDTKSARRKSGKVNREGEGSIYELR